MRIPRPLLLAALAWLTAPAAGAAQPIAQAPVLGPPPLGLDVHMPIPAENAPSAAAVALGRRLFFDPILSADGRIRCASCHLPEHAFADTARISRGAFGRRGRRNTPTILNAGYSPIFFWDGRSETLETQVLQPIEDPAEMALPVDRAVARLAGDAGYRRAFEEAFGGGPTAAALARALASYVRTLRSGGSAFDRFRAGDAGALSAGERRGFELFVGRANCATCHMGPTLSDQRFHNTGVGWRGDRPRDRGREAITGERRDRGAFKTPTLRNVALTAPYMHDGSLATLEEVVDFYARGGTPNPHLDPEIRPLPLDEADRRALVAFLRTLTGAPVAP